MKTVAASFKRSISGLSRPFRGLAKDRKGAGAVEFAIIVPLLLMGYLGAFEVSVGFGVARKVAHASNTIADVLAQQKDVTKATLDGMKGVVKAALSPYEVGSYTLKMTGIKVTGPGTGVVTWSRDQSGATPYAAGTPATLPKELTTVGTFLVRSELVVPHKLMLMAPDISSTLKEINISKTYYYQQRTGTEILCKDCTS